MKMIGMLGDQFIAVWIWIIAIHPLQMRTRNGVPKVSDDRVDEERLAQFVPVEPPWIRRSLRDSLDHATLRMVAPNASGHEHTVLFRRPRHTRAGRAGNPHAPPQPAVR